MEYLFTSKRLGFRPWREGDLSFMIEMNADKSVMKYFPSVLSIEASKEFLRRVIKHQNEKGYSYFATELLSTRALIGFIGLAYQDYTSLYTPATDIGWRLVKDAWGKGYASEGAARCIDWAFERTDLGHIIATCPLQNIASERVMTKIGMKRLGNFRHPKLGDYPALENCVCYGVDKPISF